MNKKLLFFLMLILIPLNVNANIICNDGSVSNSCKDCHQGCCSRHGGCTENPNNSAKEYVFDSSPRLKNDTTTSIINGSSEYPTGRAFNLKEEEKNESDDSLVLLYGCLIVGIIGEGYFFIKERGK